MTIHHLKILPQYFHAIIEKKKTFELRKNDRGFGVGDFLLLMEINPETHAPTEKWIKAKVKYLLDGNEASIYGLKEEFCCMSIDMIDNGSEFSQLDQHFFPKI